MGWKANFEAKHGRAATPEERRENKRPKNAATQGASRLAGPGRLLLHVATLDNNVLKLAEGVTV